MRIFISWSGERSRACATALASWIPEVMPGLLPWLSLASIPAGARWEQEVSKALGELHYGVLCLTPENVSSEWVLFAAGALSKSVSRSRVAPYLLGMEPHELRLPLSQFQATRGDEEGTWALVRAINAAAPEPLPEANLSYAFQVHWPFLASVLKTLVEARVARGMTPEQSPESTGLSASSPVEKPVANVSTSPRATRRRIARNIRARRVAAGLTQDKLAMKLGVSGHYVGKVESGDLNLSIDSLVSIARVLRVAPGGLMRAQSN